MTEARINFLRTHPATALWWEQRPTCRACAHYRRSGPAHNGSGERCHAVRLCAGPERASGGRPPHPFCIDARLADGGCGPDATLFQPRPTNQEKAKCK